MPTEAIVYRVLLAMPDDIEEERRVAKDVMLNWNSMTGRNHDIHLEPVDARDVNGRSSLNEEIDIVLGTFWATTNDSGGINYADMVRQLANEETASTIAFCEANIPTEQLDPEEYATLEAFKDDCRETGTGYFTYSNCEEYESQLRRDIARTMDGFLMDSESYFEENKDEHDGPSEYNPEVDHERLQLSEAMHRDQDERNLDRIIEDFQERGIEPPYRVLDAGCGYGTVCQRRFGGDERFEVLAIDGSEDVLKIANDQYTAQNIEYRWLDVNNLDAADLGKFDLVFVSYVFHHLDNQESALALLWDRVREDGALLIRSCDDGQHLHYPPNEDMDWVVDITDTIPGSSDRTHGRRLPTQMKRLSPTPDDVWMDMENYHTVGRDSTERREYWDVFHSNRLHYAKVRAEREDATAEDERLYADMSEQMTRIKDEITDNSHIFDAKSVPVVVAMK
jgi:SAM-dependent methyltransferase